MAASPPLVATHTTARTAAGLRRIAAACLAVLLALLAQRILQGNRPGDAVALLVPAIVIYLLAFPRAGAPLPLGAGVRLQSRWQAWAGFALCLAAAVLTLAAAPHFRTEIPSPWGWTLHLASLGLLLLGGLALDHGLRPAAQTRTLTWQIAAALVALVALAAALRLPNLGTMPFGVWYDEAANALAAQDILHNPGYRPFFLPVTSHTAHHNYLVALAFAWLGETITAARLVSALMGIAMVAAGYLVAAELFFTAPSHGRRRAVVGPFMGLLFATLLVVSSWSLNFSRIAVNYIATPLFILLAVGLLLHGLRTQRLGAYLLSGIALGMGLNFYSSFRLFLPVLPLFVGAALIAQRDLWAKSWRGLLLWGLAALIVAGPLLAYAAGNQQMFLKRSQETLIFNRGDPQDRVSALLDNTRTHLLMFNVKGDRNGRHNLPGRPMLDPYLGGLFVLGVAICIWRMRRPAYLLLLLWLAFTLLGGILTLAFEAPQSLRANGAIPAAYLIALLPIAEILRAWDASAGGRYYPRSAIAAVAILCLPIGYWHLTQYFVVQQHDFAVWNAFSTPETLIARALNTLDPDTTQVYMVSYFDGRPTVNFLAPQWRGRYVPIESSEPMPLLWPPDRDVWLFLDADSDTIYNQLQTMYPGGEFNEQTPPFAESVSTRTVHLTRAVLDSAQGLEARYWRNATPEGEPALATRAPNIDFDWGAAPPLPAPFAAEYEGVLRLTTFAPTTFGLISPGAAQLLIDEHVILSGTGALTATITPALGNHRLRVVASNPAGASGPLRLLWSQNGEPAQVLPSSVLFTAPISANGLLGNYYANDAWQPPVALAEITPQIALVYYRLPLPRPFSVEWTGKLAIPLAGDYLFALNAIDDAQLWIDEQSIVATRVGNLTLESMARLSEGLHDIRIRYRALNDHSRIGLMWTPPNGARAPLPSALLFPPMGSHDRIVIPSLEALGAAPAQSGSQQTPAAADSAPLNAASTTLTTDLQHPSGVAVGPDGRGYVVDSAAQTLLVLAPDGRIERTLTGGDSPFGEPFDVATDAEGTVYVLDAEAGSILLFAPNGDFLRALTPAAAIQRARGIAVDGEGRIWVAHTAGQRLLAFSAQGDLLHEIPVAPGADAQVTDVVVDASGRIFAVSMGINKLIEFDGAGNRVNAWDVAPANTVDAPHLALSTGDPGAIYITQPEESRVVRQSITSAGGQANGDPATTAHWQLPHDQDMVKPVGIALAPDGALWITDVQGGRVVRLAGD